MTDEQRKRIEERLLQERDRARKALAQFDDRFAEYGAQADGDLTNYPFHQADEGTDTMEEEKEMLLASQEGRVVYEIDDALRRLYKEPDRFGRCQEEGCGREIAFERLELIPWARYCKEHQEAHESAAGTR